MTIVTPYRTIVADPPWGYRTNGAPLRTRETHPDLDPAFRFQYPRMSVDEIAAIPVGDWIATDAHLYLWVTNPLLPETFPIIEAWGFRYVTCLTWHKLGPLGLGYYFRGDTEHVLFGVRGSAPIDPAIRASNHFAAKKSRHSAKPDRFYELVEAVSPAPRLELFARRRRYGWDVWGNEAPEVAASQAVLGLSFLPPSAVRTAELATDPEAA